MSHRAERRLGMGDGREMAPALESQYQSIETGAALFALGARL